MLCSLPYKGEEIYRSSGVVVSTVLSVLLQVFLGRSDRVGGRGEIALVESTDLVRSEGANDGVEDTPVVEQNEVLLAPVVWVNQR